MANNNVNNQQPVNAIDDPDLQAATILAQIAAPNNLQQQLEAERARYQALALRKYSIEIRFDTLNRLIHQRLLHIQAGLQQAQEDQQSLDLDIEVIEEENQNLRERLQAIIDENHDLQQRSNRDNAEIARLRQENQRYVLNLA
jgi:chromosome segregation ATPase